MHANRSRGTSVTHAASCHGFKVYHSCFYKISQGHRTKSFDISNDILYTKLLSLGSFLIFCYKWFMFLFYSLWNQYFLYLLF